MWPSVDALVGSAVRARLVLLVNHVLAREPAAALRLRAHAGSHLRVELTDQPLFLPQWPAMTLAVTPAGLFELEESPVEAATRLTVRVAAPDPAFDAAAPDPARSNAPYRVFNIGNHDPVPLMAFIEAIEGALGQTAQKEYLPLQDGDVPATSADVSELESWTDFRPATPVIDGVGRFVQWYRSYFKA